MTNGKEFAEKMFSEIEDNNEIQEKLYSTGNDELDDLLERAFCEGYEYAQKEFAEKEKDEEKKKKKKYKNESHRGYGRAIILGDVSGAAGRYVGKREVEKALEEGDDIETAKKRGLDKATKVGAISGAGIGLVQGAAGPGNAGQRVGRAVGAAAARGVFSGAGARWGTSRNNREWRRVDEDED